MAKVLTPQSASTAEDSFEIKEAPFLVIGGMAFTNSDILSKISWMILLLLALLVLFLALLGLEHHLATRTIFHITEEYLDKRGLLKRKGVSK
jgi:hypothetical protein